MGLYTRRCTVLTKSEEWGTVRLLFLEILDEVSRNFHVKHLEYIPSHVNFDGKCFKLWKIDGILISQVKVPTHLCVSTSTHRLINAPINNYFIRSPSCCFNVVVIVVLYYMYCTRKIARSQKYRLVLLPPPPLNFTPPARPI